MALVLVVGRGAQGQGLSSAAPCRWSAGDPLPSPPAPLPTCPPAPLPLSPPAHLPAGLACIPAKSPLPGVAAAAAAAAAAGAGASKKVLCFATGGEKGVVRIWRADTGTCLYEQKSGAAAAAGGIQELQLLPGGEGVMTATQDCRILLQCPTPPGAGGAGSGGTGGLQMVRQLIGNNDEVTDLRFVTLPAAPPAGSGGGSKDGASEKGGKRSKKEVKQAAKAAAAAVAVAAAAQPVVPAAAAAVAHGSSSGLPTHLVVSTNSEQIRIFDAATLSCTASLAGHTGIVLAIATLQLPRPGSSSGSSSAGAAAGGSSSGSGACLLASGSKDNTVRVWALSGPGGAGARCLAVGSGHVGSVGAVAFAPRKGALLVSGGGERAPPGVLPCPSWGWWGGVRGLGGGAGGGAGGGGGGGPLGRVRGSG